MAAAARHQSFGITAPPSVSGESMLDQRNDFARNPDARVLAVIALAAMSIFCLKACLGPYVLDFVMNIILWFGGYLLAFLTVLALFVSTGTWLIRKLRGSHRPAFIENQARN